MLVQAAVLAVVLFVGTPGGLEGPVLWQGAFMLAMTLLGVGSLFAAIGRGWSSGRWIGFASLILMGLSLIWLAYWQTTLDFPNAISPLERAKMQDQVRNDLPWMIAWGVLNLLVSGLLFVPSVRQFLGAQRVRTQERNMPSQAIPDGLQRTGL
jgi:hypothetical protein